MIRMANFPVKISFAVDERDDELIAGCLLCVGQDLTLRARPYNKRRVCEVCKREIVMQLTQPKGYIPPSFLPTFHCPYVFHMSHLLP